MIKTEFLNDGTLIKHYSDAGFMLLQVETGIKYSDPVDVVPCRYTYEETEEKIDNDKNTAVDDDKLHKSLINTNDYTPEQHKVEQEIVKEV